MDETNVPASVADDAPAPQPVQGKHCLTCGYSLDGLLDTDMCSECARPVADSLHRWTLGHADRTHLGILNRGLWLIILGMVFFSLSALFCAGAFWVYPDEKRLISLAFFSRIPPLFVAAWGVWMFTRIDPNAGALVSMNATRWVARVASIFTLILCVRPPTDLLHAVLVTALMQYTLGLAERVPDEGLVRWSRCFRWMLPALLVPVVLFVALALSLPMGFLWLDDSVFFGIQIVLPVTLILTCVPLQRLQGQIAEMLEAAAPAEPDPQ